MSVDDQKLCEYRAKSEASAATFFREAWRTLEPGMPLADSWHYDYIAEYLEAVYRGEVRRLIVNVPPGSAKSDGGHDLLAGAVLGSSSQASFLCASYSMDLSRDHSIKRRTLMESEWYKTTWPDIEFSRDTNRQDQYKNLNEGEMIATSVGLSGTTGRGADISDPRRWSERRRSQERTAAQECPLLVREHLHPPSQ